MSAPEHRTLTTKSQLFSDKALSLSRWLTLLGACASPLLAQAQNCPTGDNIDDQYILGEANGVASAMHWPLGWCGSAAAKARRWRADNAPAPRR